MLSGSLWFVAYIRAPAVCRRARRVHSDASWGSSGLFGCVGFVRKRPWGRRYNWHSLGSLGYALCVDRYIRVRLVHSGAPRVSSGSFGCALLVISLIQFPPAPRGLSGSFGFVAFMRARPGGRRVHSCLSGSFAHSLGESCSFVFVGFIRACPGGSWVHSVTLWGLSGSFGFVQACPVGRRVHFD